MKKPQTNYAFIDGQNLNLGVQELGWKVDQRKFRVYLAEKYGCGKAYYFIGFVQGQNALYNSLQSAGYVLTFKPTSMDADGNVKGNVDAELVLQAMIDLANYEQAVLVTGDGDFACLVNYLRPLGKLRCVLAPNMRKCSALLKKAAANHLSFMDDLRGKLEYKGHEKKSTP